ncbi:LacI family DNA-binding transcriptional regulator [Microbacterium karelineae]|uniref:LacI family DNA-binding transcriptional regulator n=1 Tax=Microbacterium karelineae TaxID=2654283 RepID=UPI0012EA51E9|nr:LacI family DNA-binding transcriptional regulator [Microbacterium karelineae]
MPERDRTRRVGIRDVAAAAGLSPTTVSHAFSGARALNAETRARVLETAERLGYSPDPLARGLRGARTYTIGFLSDVIGSSPHAGRMVSGAQEAAAERDSVLIMLDSNGIPEREALQIRTLRAHRVDGFVYARMSHERVEVPDELHDAHVVLADTSTPDPRFSSVVPDEYGIGRTATRRLLEAGHRRIGFSTIRDDVEASIGRERGYRDALAEAGVGVDETLIARTTADTAGGRSSGTPLLDRHDPATAVFCFNDEVGMGIYQAASRLGLSVPGDISVVGVDDLEIISRGLLPPLTTVALPHEEMGRWAVAQLLRAVEGEDAPTQRELACPLVERGSIAPPP